MNKQSLLSNFYFFNSLARSYSPITCNLWNNTEIKMRNPVNIACIKNDENLHLLRTVKCLLVFRHRVLQGVLQIHTTSLHLRCCIWSVDLDEICVKTPVGRQLSSDYTSAKAQENKLFQHESGINYAHFTNSRSA